MPQKSRNRASLDTVLGMATALRFPCWSRATTGVSTSGTMTIASSQSLKSTSPAMESPVPSGCGPGAYGPDSSTSGVAGSSWPPQ